MLIESPATLKAPATKLLLEGLESRFIISLATATSSVPAPPKIDHLLKHLGQENSPDLEVPHRVLVHQERSLLLEYAVRVVLCAYMILGHPNPFLVGLSSFFLFTFLLVLQTGAKGLKVWLHVFFRLVKAFGTSTLPPETCVAPETQRQGGHVGRSKAVNPPIHSDLDDIEICMPHYMTRQLTIDGRMTRLWPMERRLHPLDHKGEEMATTTFVTTTTYLDYYYYSHAYSFLFLFVTGDRKYNC